jgi:Tol biopolymer transport system component
VPALPAKGSWGAPQLSPDGRRVAVEVGADYAHTSIAIADLYRQMVTTVVPSGRTPLWTPDGTRITFGSVMFDSLWWQASDGSGKPELLYRSMYGGVSNEGSWTRDGRLTFTDAEKVEISQRVPYLLANEGAEWVVSRFDRLEDVSRYEVVHPRVSPDGRWIAYSANVTGSFEVWLQAYPTGGQRRQISAGGGYDPVWSADGSELFYRDGDRFFRVPVTLTQTVTIGSAQLLFTGPFLDPGPIGGRGYDVSGDGQRFLVVRVSDEERAPRRFHLVQNWFEELKAKVPVGGAK